MFEKRTAFKLWTKMRPQIEKLAKGVEGFAPHLEIADYINQSYIACVEAVKRYDETKAVNMSLQTFAFWHIQKAIHKMAEGSGEIVYIAHSPTGNIKTLNNSQYRKMKTKLELQGYTFISERIVVPFPEGDKDNNGNNHQDGNSHHYFDF